MRGPSQHWACVTGPRTQALKLIPEGGYSSLSHKELWGNLLWLLTSEWEINAIPGPSTVRGKDACYRDFPMATAPFGTHGNLGGVPLVSLLPDSSSPVHSSCRSREIYSKHNSDPNTPLSNLSRFPNPHLQSHLHTPFFSSQGPWEPAPGTSTDSFLPLPANPLLFPVLFLSFFCKVFSYWTVLGLSCSMLDLCCIM